MKAAAAATAPTKSTVRNGFPSRSAIDSRAGIAIDQRHRRVHEQHCKRHAVGVAAPGAYRISEKPYTSAVDQTSATRRRGRYRIRRDEECAEQGRAAEEVKSRRGVAAQIGRASCREI